MAHVQILVILGNLLIATIVMVVINVDFVIIVKKFKVELIVVIFLKMIIMKMIVIKFLSFLI